MGLKRYAKKVGKTVKGAAKKYGRFTPQGQAYQIFKGAKEGGLKGAIGEINPLKAVTDFGGLMGRKNKMDKSIDAGTPEAVRSTAAKKLIRRPYKGQAGAGQIEYMAEYEE